MKKAILFTLIGMIISAAIFFMIIKSNNTPFQTGSQLFSEGPDAPTDQSHLISDITSPPMPSDKLTPTAEPTEPSAPATITEQPASSPEASTPTPEAKLSLSPAPALEAIITPTPEVKAAQVPAPS